MALGLKYFARYRDIDGVVKEIRFLKNDYDGASEEWLCTNGAVTFDYAGFDGMFEQPIIASQAQISLHLTEFYDLSEFVFNRKTFFCEIWNTVSDTIQWTGWVEPWNAQRPHRKPPWNVSLTASCGLAHLSKKKYLNTTNVFKKTGLAIIRECLQAISVTQPIRISTHLVETTWGGDDRLGLNSFEINTARYYDQNGEAMYCDVVVNDILNHFTAEILQEKNRWVIRSVVDNATGLATGYIDIDNPGAPADMPFTYVINGEGSATLEGGNVTILPPINKYRTEIDFGTQMPFFENGNMVLWTENGLVGWDFAHMAKGKPGWERFEIGGEVSRGVLQINGKSPNPIRKKKPVKKKNGWLKRLLVIPLIVDAIKLVSKKAWIDIEPAQYIESSGGTIGRGDASVTISFDYETEAFSSDILISIRIPITQKSGKVVNFWVDPSQGVAVAGADESLRGATEEFQLIRIPAVDMGSLTDKGSIDVSGNPNYPVANFTPGSKQINWTWTVTGVPAGQSRKIGGVNGVIVENGDLIIARIPNNGGTQAEVGGSWEVVNVRNNTKKGTFSIPVAINQLIITKAGDPWPADKIYVRFYKMADDPGFPGDWYRVYNLNGALEGFVPKEESARYATTLQRGDVTDEEAKTINLISGDYNPWYSGSWTKPGSIENTRTWRRRPDLDEAMSIYRAMMLDRLCLTSRPLRVVEGEILIAPGEAPLSYLHTILMHDMDDMRMRITRYSFNDYSRRVRFTAVEVKYEEIPSGELKQDAYIPGSRQLNTIPGQGDGVYPSKQDSTNGRLSAEDVPLTEAELLEAIENGSRLSALFENIPPLIFTVGELSTESVDLNEYLSAIVSYNNENQEEEDQFDFKDLEWETLRKPSWVSAQSVVFLDVNVTGKPTSVGQYSITFKVGEQEITKTDEEVEAEEDLAAEAEEAGVTIPPDVPFYIEVTIPIVVYPKTRATYTLLETSAKPIIIGSLPGSYPLPAKWDQRIKITGQHDGYQITTVGGGDTGTEINHTVNQGVTETNEGTYLVFQEDNGITTSAGLFRTYVTTFLNERTVSRQNITFTLYDDEFLNALKFFLTQSGTDIGEISPDGTSVFNNPGSWDVRALVADTPHDKAIIRLNEDDGTVIHETPYVLGSPSSSGNYFIYGSDQALSPKVYNATIILSLAGTDVLMRYVDFEIGKKIPVAAGGSLKLVQMVPSTTNYTVLGELALSGNLFTLPTNWALLSDGESEEFDWEGFQLFELRAGVLVEVDVTMYTGIPQFISYGSPVTQSNYLLFGGSNSTLIDSIHHTPSTFRAIVPRRLGGSSSDLVVKYQADFSFGTLTPIDDAPVTDPGASIVGVEAGNAMRKVTEDYITTLHWQPDGITLGVKEAEDPNDPDADPLNVAEILDEGVTFAKIQNLPPKTVIGNPSGSEGVTSAIPIAAISTADPGDLVTVEYLEDLIADSINGTENFISMFGADDNLVNTIIRQSVSGNIGVGMTATEKFEVAGNIKGVQLISTVATGTAPLVVSSTTKVTNLQSDFVGRNIIAGTGLTGGGILTADRTISLDTTYADGRYFPAVIGVSDFNVPTGFKVLDSTTGTPANAPTSAYTQGIQFSATNNPAYINQLVFNLTGDFYQRSKVGGSWGSWKQIADRPWVIANYAPLTRLISTGTGLLGGGSLGADRTLTFDVAWGDARYATSSTSSLDWNLVNSDVLSKFNSSSTNGPLAGVVHGIYVPQSGSTAYGTSIVFRNTGVWVRSVEAGVWGSWISMASQPWVAANYVPLTRQVLAGAGLVNGGDLTADINIAMGTPSTLTNATTNSVSGSTHTHAITTSDLIAGTNVSFSGSGVDRILGSSDLTINVSSLPWSGITSRPTTLVGFGLDGDAFTKSEVTTLLTGKEDTFSKGNLVAGTNVGLAGTLTNRLVGSGNVTISVTSFPFSSLTGIPTTLSGYGITDAVPSSRTLTINGTTYDLTANRSWTISGGLTGSGTPSAVAVWDTGGVLTDSSCIYSVGNQITIDGHLVVQNGIIGFPRFASDAAAETALGGSPIGGEAYFNTTSDAFRGHDGTDWRFLEMSL
jgi:hypothetical protein